MFNNQNQFQVLRLVASSEQVNYTLMLPSVAKSHSSFVDVACPNFSNFDEQH